MSGTWVPFIGQRFITSHRYKDGVRQRNGVLCHIAEGTYNGTIAWQMNTTDPRATTSSEFIIGRNPGEVAQMMPLEDAAWAQREANRYWIAIEFAGWVQDGLTDWQIQCAGRIYEWLNWKYGGDNYPFRITSDPIIRGLGYHSMGAEHGLNWGHPNCPGDKVKAKRSNIIVAAVDYRNQRLAAEESDNMPSVSEIVTGILSADLGHAGGGDTVGVALQTGYNNGIKALAEIEALKAEVAELKALLTPPSTI